MALDKQFWAEQQKTSRELFKISAGYMSPACFDKIWPKNMNDVISQDEVGWGETE